jgi:prepilin-type processing-associated H-X9-DG protein
MTSQKAGVSPRAVGYTDYWMNARFSGINQSELTASALSVLMGEGNDGTDATDARYALDSLPAAWISNTESPLYRHINGCNYAFADGHVKWFQATKRPGNTKPDQGRVTFAVK